MADFSFIPTTAAAFVSSAWFLLIVIELLAVFQYEPGLIGFGLISLTGASIAFAVIVKMTSSPQAKY